MPFYNSLPLIGLHLKSNSRLDIFSAEEQAQLQAQYRDSLGLGKNATFSADAFDKLVESRIKDFEGFKEAKAPDGRLLKDNLVNVSPFNPEDTETIKAEKTAHQKNAEAFKKTIEEALIPFPDAPPKSGFIQAQKDYKESVATFRQLADKIPYKYKAEDLIGAMKELNDTAIKAIKEQQQKEMLAFEAPDFKTKLADALNLKAPGQQAEIDAAHNRMMNDLKGSHTAQLAEFEKSATASVTALHTAAASEMSQLLFIANLRKNNVEMQQKIAELAALKRQQAGFDPLNTTVTVGIDKDQISLAGITVADLGTITSITGKEIRQDGKGNFSMTMEGYSIASPLSSLKYLAYSQDPRQNVKADMLLMAQAVKACGYDKITMNVNFENPTVANTRARQTYEAAILAGFPKDKIVIMVNGKEMKHEDIFKDHPESFRRINEKSATIAADTAKLTSSENFLSKGPSDLTEIKKDMAELRTKAKEEEAKREAALSSPPTEDQPSLLNPS